MFLKAGRRKSWLYVRKGATSLGPTALLEPFSQLQPFCLCSEPWVERSSRAPFPGLAARLGTAPKPAARELQLGAALGAALVRWQPLLQGVAALKQLLQM